MFRRPHRFLALIPLLLTVLCLGIGISVFTGGLNFSGLTGTGETQQGTDADSQEGAETLESEQTQETGATEENAISGSVGSLASMEAIPVSLEKAGSPNIEFLEANGTVTNRHTVEVFPALQGEVIKLRVKEGDTVKKGDVLAVLGGMNGQAHMAEKQYQLAQVAYDTAVKSYNNMAAAAGAALRSAELQIQSVRNQTTAGYMDYAAGGPNIDTVRESLDLLNESLDTTRDNNRRAIRDLEDQLEDLDGSDDEDDMGNPIDTDATRDALEAQLEAAQANAILAENQILSQMLQLENQEQSLQNSYESMQYRQGLFNGSSDALLATEQARNSTILQQNSMLAQADAAVGNARLNLEMAQMQKSNLVVLAPVNGVLGEMNGSEGSLIGPQTALAEITPSGNAEVTVEISAARADAVHTGTKAEVKIGSKFVPALIKSVGASASSTSQLVKVTLELGGMTLRPNQTLSVRLPVFPENIDAESMTLPLDAVTIGTDESFVYIVQNGKARKISVQTGDVLADRIEITGGLRRSMQVIVDGARQVSEGQPVTI